MYLIRQEHTVHRRASAEAHFARLGELRKTMPGFQRRFLLHSLGYPAKYVSLVRWESRDAAEAFAARELEAFNEANPSGHIFTAIRPSEAYEFVLGVGEPEAEQGVFMTLVEWTLNPGRAAEFERSRKDQFELRQRGQKGFLANGLYRFMGNPNKYLILQRYASREEMRAARTVPEISQFTQANPFGKYASVPPVGETYSILQAQVSGSRS